MVTTQPLLDRVSDFHGLLSSHFDEAAEEAVRQAPTIGRPLMDQAAIKSLEGKLGIPILPRKRGPKPKVSEELG